MNARHPGLRYAALLAALCAPPAHSVEHIEGQAVRLADGTPVYRERHRIEEHRHRVDYHGPAGEPIGELRLDFRCNDSAPDFEQIDRRAGERQTGRWRDGEYLLERDTGASAASAALAPGALPLVASSGFDRFLRAQRERLLGGETVTFRFAMPARLSDLRLRARHDREARDGLDWFVIEPDQAVLRAFVQPLRVAYDGQQRLAVYRGPSNLLDADGSALRVEIRYTHAEPARQDVTDAEPRAPEPRTSGQSNCPTENT